MFKVGRVYNRVMGIHEPYEGRGEGASQHLGTCPSYSCAPGRAASSTEQYDYRDGCDGKGVFLTSGNMGFAWSVCSQVL